MGAPPLPVRVRRSRWDVLGETDHLGVPDVVQAYRAARIWIEPHPDRNRDELSSLEPAFWSLAGSDWRGHECRAGDHEAECDDPPDDG